MVIFEFFTFEGDFGWQANIMAVMSKE